MSTSASIVVRVKNPDTGKRSWIVATGKKTDPEGSYYIRTKQNGSPRYAFAGESYAEACAERIKTERRLKAAEIGAVLVDEPAPVSAPAVARHRLTDMTEAHIAEESKPDKNGDVRPAKSLKSVRSEMNRFIEWSEKTYVEELTEEMLKGYRDWLITVGKDGEPYQPDTAYNKLMVITTVLKNNPLCPTKPLLPVSEFPDKKETIPDPYTEAEFDGFMLHADYEDALRIYAYARTGLRDQELAHAERRDIDWDLGVLYIVKKRERGFKGKTPAALRAVPLNEDLLAEYALRPEGLLHPAPEGGVDGHFGRRVEEIAKAAKIKATTEKPHMVAAGMVKDDWLHRFRDTHITNALHRCKNMSETMLMCKRVGHGDMSTLEKYHGRLKKPYEPQFPERLRKAAKVADLEAMVNVA